MGRKKAIDISVFNQKDEYTYTILLRHLTQIINGKNKLGKKPDYRDKKMAENILFYQNENTLTKGFFWAHNGHVMKSIFNEGKKKESGSAGGYLKQKMGSQYFVIGQDFEEGTFNAYFPDSNSLKNLEGDTYTLGPVTVTPFLKSSFITNYGTLKSPVFINCSYLPQKKHIELSSIGAAYYPDKNGNHKSKNSRFYHKKSEFDAIILIQKSTATHLLEDLTNNNGN